MMGPLACRDCKNQKITKKILCAVIQDIYSGAIHSDNVRVLLPHILTEVMWKFAALRGGPKVITSDLGSKNESAACDLDTWCTN